MLILVLIANAITHQARDPKVRLPIFGASRPLCGTCASFLSNSLRASGASIEASLSIVPSEPRAYSACCMPHGPKPAVVEKVAMDLESALSRALKEPVRDSFHALAKSAGGHRAPDLVSPNPSDPDTASDTSDNSDPCQPS